MGGWGDPRLLIRRLFQTASCGRGAGAGHTTVQSLGQVEVWVCMSQAEALID